MSLWRREVEGLEGVGMKIITFLEKVTNTASAVPLQYKHSQQTVFKSKQEVAKQLGLLGIREGRMQLCHTGI